MGRTLLTLAVAVGVGLASAVRTHGQEASAGPLSAGVVSPQFDGCGIGNALAVQPRRCEIPGYPTPQNIQSIGVSWCRSNVGFQRRAIALQAAGSWCELLGGTPNAAAHRELIHTVCDRLDALAALGGPPCQCPAGYRP